MKLAMSSFLFCRAAASSNQSMNGDASTCGTAHAGQVQRHRSRARYACCWAPMNRPNVLVAMLLASFFLAGLFEPKFLPRSPTAAEIAEYCVSTFLVFAWCKADAVHRGIRPPIGAPVLCAFVPPLGLPYYFFRTRPWRSALLGLLKALGIFVLTAMLFCAGAYTHVVA